MPILALQEYSTIKVYYSITWELRELLEWKKKKKAVIQICQNREGLKIPKQRQKTPLYVLSMKENQAAPLIRWLKKSLQHYISSQNK